ncbi:hypothetical protein PENARI_c021G09285 [Penicillium arizonense]|uniref:Cytochrome P450 n=1 Tax=Penicillium arizonense TaxID=1835702 RepID=A0A1F5L986_PENAI|nr:hypothetical protein PENARI_c021G09285 [Penicillium arizonense]OGE49550.1 hypothetical protein PENARI_c021G09285 [Penicillium arizonense]
MGVLMLSWQAMTLLCILLGLYIYRTVMTVAILRGNCHEWHAEVNKKYGPVARVAPRVLLTSSPEVWMHVNNKPGYKRSDWYYKAARIEYRRDNVFSQTDNAKHERRRKQIAPGYSGRENINLEGSVDEQVQDFLNLIRSKYISSDRSVVPIDLAKKVQYFTLDIISILDSQAPFIGRFIAPSPKDNNGFGKMMAACFRLVDERATSSTNEQSDILASFMRHSLAGDELRTKALEQIIAGSDTTTSAIRGTLLHLMTNPRVYLRLQREVDDAAVICEALRVWPPVANILPRDIPTGGDTIVVDGQSVFLPGRICIRYSAYAMHQSEKVYGKDAKAFRPER